MYSQYITDLNEAFSAKSNSEIAQKQAAYMRDQFAFFGVMSKTRKEIGNPFLSKELRPAKTELNAIIHELWNAPQRELQYFGQELCAKYFNQTEAHDIEVYEFMITSKSWWDTVDFIASHLVGQYFKIYPEKIPGFMDKWLASENIWLQRTCLIFQLKYKKQTDHDLLETLIQSLNGTDEFFINKAIGWALREYSKINPEWVGHFIYENELSKLSEREGLRLIRE